MSLWRTLVMLVVASLVAGTAAASRENPAGEGIPDPIPAEHWVRQDVAWLGENYGVEPALNAENPAAKQEVVDRFIDVLKKMVTDYDKNGSSAVSRDGLESMRAVIVALENELFANKAYMNIRRRIEQLLVLAEPPVPVYKSKIGVNGFLRTDAVDNFRLPDGEFNPEHGEGRFLYRIKPYAYFHPNDYLGLHMEGQGYGYKGGNQSEWKPSLYQGFVEAQIPVKASPGRNWLALKAGRQEFEYGSAFVQGADAFFNGLTFDAVRLRTQPRWSLTMDLLGGQYAAPSSDGTEGNLAGAYFTYEPADGDVIEAYAFRDTADDRQSGEHLNTSGYRSAGAVGIFTLEHEGAYQTGEVFNPNTGANDEIRAYGGHVDLTGEFLLRWFGGKAFDNEVFLSAAAGSGDQNAADGIGTGNKEFRNSNHDTSLVGDMGVVGDFSGFDVGNHHASGLAAFTLGWGIDFTKKLNFSATGRKFIAQKVETGFNRDIGVETDLTLAYTKNKDTAFVLGYDRFFTGPFFRDASGSDKDVHYAYAMVLFNYDWTKRKRVSRIRQ
ncbi:MAG: alginate export family protein [Elusimicrobia bacterium]|nr:alginate export family protein [Elusimicrobiota bacterium]